jgi:hypothetical protein
MADLPSYFDAVRRPDWLPLVAPHVRPRDYAACCRVAAAWHVQFAPRLWNDPLVAARQLGLHPNDGEQYTSYCR